MFRRPLGISVMLALLGCGGHTLDVGSTDGAAGITPDRGPEAGAHDESGPLWNGVLENAQLSDGSDRLAMTLAVAPDGAATGTVLLGDGTLLAPPADPNVGYPPGAQFSVNPPEAFPITFYEGFQYTMRNGRLRGSTLTFDITPYELWAAWCAMQSPYPYAHDVDGGTLYRCDPNGDSSEDSQGHCSQTDPSTLRSVPIDCNKQALCWVDVPCDCTATACGAASLDEPTIAFSLVIDGASADGTLSGALGTDQVHFVRAQ